MSFSFKTIKKQAGFTATGWVFVALIGGFFAYLAMLLFPVVVNNYTVDTILTSLQNEPGITDMPRENIRSLINKRLRINDIRDIKASDFEIVRENNDLVIVYLDYETRVQFAEKIFILIIHNKQVELTRN